MKCTVCNGVWFLQAAAVQNRVTAEGEKAFVLWGSSAVIPCFACQRKVSK